MTQGKKTRGGWCNLTLVLAASTACNSTFQMGKHHNGSGLFRRTDGLDDHTIHIYTLALLKWGVSLFVAM